MTDQTWNPLLRDQFAWHRTSQLREFLGDTGLARPREQAVGPHAARPLAALVPHTHQQTRREAS